METAGFCYLAKARSMVSNAIYRAVGKVHAFRFLFESEGYAYITPPKTSEVTGDIVSNVAGKTSGNASDNSMSEQVGEIRQALVVARPLNSYLVNTKVLPVVEGQTGGQADDK